MPFEFLKYLHPTHYFQRFKNSGYSAFPIYQDLPNEIRNILSKDHRYDSSISKEYDVSWQAIRYGYTGDSPTYQGFEHCSISDNYRFLRKNFHKAWVLYVLLIRILSLKNPFKEIKGFRESNNMDRQKFEPDLILKTPISVDSKKDYPLVSVVIPTLNRYEYLKDVLSDFEEQDYKNFEIIIVDQSENFNLDFYKKFKLNIELIRQEEKALWLARNTAIKAAKGDLIALSEDDVRVNKNWLSSHLQCLYAFNAEVSAGVFYPKGGSIPIERSFYAIASQFATGNSMLYKSVFKKVGLFDRQFEKQRMGDGEFGMRLYLNNIRCISNPIAFCIDVKAPAGGLREMGSWDAYRPSSLLSARPIPSVLYFYRTYFGNRAAKLDLLKNVPLSLLPYRYKRNRPMLVLALVISLLLIPIVLFQVLLSWKLSTAKLKEGSKIENI